MNKSHKAQASMLQGALFPQILRFCLPLIAANLLQVAFNMADTVVVGLSGEPDAVGAVGTTSSFINLIINVFIGCSVGAKVVMARSLGAGNKKAVSETLNTALGMSVLFGVLCGAVGFILSGSVLRFMGNSGKLYELALLYTRLYFVGVPFVSVVNFSSSLLHASGDTKTPMKILTLGGAVNVVLNLFFVLVCGRSVDGVAAATVLSNALCALLFVRKLMKGELFQLKLSQIGIRKTPFLKILHIGLPAGVQSMLFSVSHMLIQSSVITVNTLTAPPDAAFAPVVKGVSAATGIEGFANIAVNAVGQAAVCFVGQNAGAQNYKRVRSVRRCCYLIGVGAAILFGSLLILARAPLFSLYGIHRAALGSVERMAYDAAEIRTFYMLVPYIFLAFMEVGSGTMQGLGRAVTAAGVSLAGSCVFRVAWLLAVFPKHQTLACIFISFPLSWLLTAAVHFICAEVILKRLERASESAKTEKQLLTAADKK